MRLAISIAHAAHRPERVESLGRMMAQLLPANPYVECEPGKYHEWSLRQWQGALHLAAHDEATHALLLNDDVELCDDFLDVLAKVIEARPTHLVNLYNTSPLAIEAQKRDLSWLTSPDGLIGMAYVLPVAGLKEFLSWRATKLTAGTVEALTEDQLLNLWAMHQGALIWHTVPALVDHDVSVPSCYDNTQCRRPAVGPRPGMLDVDWNTDALHSGRIFNGNHKALLTRVLGPRKPLVTRYYDLAGDQ